MMCIHLTILSMVAKIVYIGDAAHMYLANLESDHFIDRR